MGDGREDRAAIVAGGAAVRCVAGGHAQVSSFKAGIEAGRRCGTQWQTDGRAVQAVLECSGFHCRGRACDAAYGDRRETSHCNLSQSGHLPLQCFVPNTRRIISHGACLVGDTPTVIKLWQTAPKSNRYLHLKAGETSFPRRELQKCHEIDPLCGIAATTKNAVQSRYLQSFAAANCRPFGQPLRYVPPSTAPSQKSDLR